MRHHIESGLWAIRPEAIPTVLQLLSGPAPDGATQFPQTPASRRVAVIGIHGVLSNDRPAYFGDNYLGIASGVEKAASDPNIERIVLSVDSPGGEVTGLPECAAVIAQAAKIKPVHAVVEGVAASAAYWLASQASDITLTPSGEVGSVGVRMMHVDCSAMLEKAGYRVTELHSGDFKTEFSPFKPLTDEATADMQSRLDSTHREFIGAVAAGRGSRASDWARKSKFGQGRMFSSGTARQHGLVDAVMSPKDFYRSLVTTRTPSMGISPRRARLELERSRLV